MALAELKLKVFLCASTYPEPKDTLARIGLDVTPHLDGFVKAIGRNEILPFLGAYQRLVYSYFFFKKLTKKYKPDFVLVTGGSTLVPKSMASKTIVYVHYPDDVEVASEGYLRGRTSKKLYIQPWIFISRYLNSAKNCTNSD